MATVQLLLNVLAPVLVVVVLGMTTGSRLGIDDGTLSRLAYWIFGPAFMVDVLHDADLAWSVIGQLAAAGIAGMIVAALIALSVSRLAGDGYDVTAAGVMSSAYGNVGNAGLAISVFALGDAILPAAGIFMLAINLSGMMLGVSLAHGRDGSIGSALLRSLTAPMTIAGASAMFVNAIDLELPTVPDRATSLLASALIPIMLYALGMQLKSAWGDPDGEGMRRSVGVVAAAKLIAAPLGAAGVGSLLGLSGDLLAVAVIQSAMPPAVFCMVVAVEHDLAPKQVTAMVAFTTVLSVATLPVVLFLVI